MKYTTTLKSALALAMGLVVGTASAVTTTQSDVQSYADTFDTYAAGLKIGDAANNATFRDMEAETGWFAGSADDESAISNRTDAAGNMLWLNTEASTLSNKFTQAVATELNAGIVDKGAYFESEIKFVASDTLDPGIKGGTDDAKFAIYAYCKDEGMPTNLVVYHAVMDYEGTGVISFTNEVFDGIFIDTTAYSMLRINMKRLADPDIANKFYNVFSVTINGTTLSSTTALDAAFKGTETGIWFKTVEETSNDDNKLVSALTFTGTGEIDNVKAGVITETTAYTVDWTGSEYVVVSNATEAIASSPTNLPACTLTFYPTEGNQITNVLVGGVAQAFDPASFVLDVSSDTNVVVLAGVQASPATGISVATVGDATVTGSDGTYTITIPEGNSLSSVFVNGAAVDPSLLTDNQDGTYTLDLSAADTDVKVVVAATKTRAAPEHKWWENPGVVGTTASGLSNESTYGLRYMNGAGDFVAATGWNSNRKVKGYDLDDLVAGNAEAIITNEYPTSAGTWGVAISPALNVLLVGENYNGKKLISYPLNEAGVVGENAYLIETDNNTVHGLQDMEFTADNRYLYALDYETRYVYKYQVLNGLKSDGTNLVRVATYDFGDDLPAGGIGAIGVGQFQGGDVIYAMIRNTGVIKYIDTSAPTVVNTLNASAPIGGWGDIMVSAADTATPRITIIGCKMGYDDKSLEVYTLNATGTAVVGEPLLSLDGPALRGIGLPNANTYGYSGFITPDEATFVFGWNNTLCAIQYLEPQYTATYTGSENVIVTNTYDGSSYQWGEGEAVVPTQIACLTGTVLSFYPTEGNVITNVTIGGVEQTGFDPACYSITVISDTNLVVLAGVQSTPPQVENYAAGDTVGAETLNADVAAWLNTKKGTATKAAFEKTLDEDEFTLTEEYLLNTDPTVDTTVEFKISSITVGSTVDLQVTLTRTEGNEAVDSAINGTLKIKGAAAVNGSYAVEQTLTDKFNGATTATKSFSTENKFFKAVIE